MDNLVFIAPQPDLLPKYLALVYPLQLEVWICVVVSVLIFSLLFCAIAKVEELPGRATKKISQSLTLEEINVCVFLEYIW